MAMIYFRNVVSHTKIIPHSLSILVHPGTLTSATLFHPLESIFNKTDRLHVRREEAEQGGFSTEKDMFINHRLKVSYFFNNQSMLRYCQQQQCPSASTADHEI